MEELQRLINGIGKISNASVATATTDRSIDRDIDGTVPNQIH